jgi:hypothetical protein
MLFLCCFVLDYIWFVLNLCLDVVELCLICVGLCWIYVELFLGFFWFVFGCDLFGIYDMWVDRGIRREEREIL